MAVEDVPTVVSSEVVILAAAAALAIKVPALFGVSFSSNEHVGFYARNLSLFAFPVLTALTNIGEISEMAKKAYTISVKIS